MQFTLNNLSAALTPEVPEVPAGETAVQVAEVEQDAAQLQAHDQVLTGGDNVAATADAGAEVLEKAAVTGDGVDAQAVEVAETALEHFHARLQRPYKRRGSAAFQLTTPAERKIAAKQLAKEMRALSVETRKLTLGIRVAKEGFFANVAYAFKDLFATEESVRGMLRSAAAAYDSNPVREDAIVDAPWAKKINLEGREKIDGKYVVELAKRLIKEARSEAMAKDIEKLVPILDRLNKEVSSGAYREAEDDYRLVQKLESEATGMVSEMMKVGQGLGKANKRVEATALTADEKDNLVEALEELLSDSKLTKALEELDKTITFYYNSGSANSMAVGYGFMGDIRVSMIMADAGSFLSKLYSVEAMVLSFVHAAVNYLKDSTATTHA